MSTHFIITAEFVAKAILVILFVLALGFMAIVVFINDKKRAREQRKKPNQLGEIRYTLHAETYQEINNAIKKINEKIHFINTSDTDVEEKEEKELQATIEKTNEAIHKFRLATSDVRLQTVDILTKILDNLIEKLNETGVEKKTIKEIEGIAEDIVEAGESKKN